MENIFDEDIKKCVEVMRGGGIILYPTNCLSEALPALLSLAKDQGKKRFHY